MLKPTTGSTYLAFLQSWITFCNSNVITHPPIDTVGCYGGISTFYCRMDSMDITKVLWSVEGDQLNDNIRQLRGITTDNLISNTSETSYLHISGWSINDDIILSCQVFLTISPYILSKGAVFTVDPPPPVSHVMANPGTNGTSTVLNWPAPVCVPLNSSYFITVESGSIGTAMHITDNLTVTINTSLCLSYNISVQVISHGYNSSSTTISQYENPNDIEIIIVDNIVIEFLHNNRAYGNLTGKVKGKFCSGEIIVNSTIHMRNYQPSSGVTQTVSAITFQNNEYQLKEVPFNHVIGPFDQGMIGEVYITWNPSTNNESIVYANISFVTFHVQDLVTSVSNGILKMCCYFGSNSSADGCLVTIAVNTKPPYINFTLSRGSQPLVLALPSGNTLYTITAYDIVNGTIGDHYSAIDEIFVENVIDPSISTSANVLDDSFKMSSSNWNKADDWSHSSLVYLKADTHSVVSMLTTSVMIDDGNKEVLNEFSSSVMTSVDLSSHHDTTMIISITLSSIIVSCSICVICIITGTLILTRRKLAKEKQKQNFNMYNANLEEVQVNAAYSTVVSRRVPVNEVETTDNPSYATCIHFKEERLYDYI